MRKSTPLQGATEVQFPVAEEKGHKKPPVNITIGVDPEEAWRDAKSVAFAGDHRPPSEIGSFPTKYLTSCTISEKSWKRLFGLLIHSGIHLEEGEAFFRDPEGCWHYENQVGNMNLKGAKSELLDQCVIALEKFNNPPPSAIVGIDPGESWRNAKPIVHEEDDNPPPPRYR